MAIFFHAEGITNPEIDYTRANNWILRVIQTHKYNAGDINIVFCKDDYLQKINKRYLNREYFTDIITFDYTEGDILSGDLYISLESTNSNAKDYSENDENLELHRVIIHGILHLLGYKDDTDKNKLRMTSHEDECLAILKEIC